MSRSRLFFTFLINHAAVALLLRKSKQSRKIADSSLPSAIISRKVLTKYAQIYKIGSNKKKDSPFQKGKKLETRHACCPAPREMPGKALPVPEGVAGEGSVVVAAVSGDLFAEPGGAVEGVVFGGKLDFGDD